MKSFEIIFDNGGGATLQFNADNVYCFGGDMIGLAESAKAAMSGDDPASWDGNTPGQYITDDAHRAAQQGGYRVIDSETLAESIDQYGWQNMIGGWTNIQQFAEAFSPSAFVSE